MTRSRRGQVVLAAAVVAAVALAPLVTAYLQLGYVGDVTASRAATDPAADTTRALERAVDTVAPDLAREYRWGERRAAVDAFRTALDPHLDGLRTASLGDGTAIRVERNESTAAAWRRAHCSRGDGRRFGGCQAIDGVVVQNRAGQTHVLAVAFDVRVVALAGSTRLTVVVRRW